QLGNFLWSNSGCDSVWAVPPSRSQTYKRCGFQSFLDFAIADKAPWICSSLM
uniref:Uncharacterized protein n=1 Tax=Scleropages formosus TaxID=113540 RepID=A0A8C9R8V4_SCLFO